MVQTEPLHIRESNGADWFIGTIVAIALIAIGYLVFSANARPPVAPLASAHVKVVTDRGHGSATHIGNGLFLTAAHVVNGATAVSAGGEPVEVLWANSAYDVALLRGPDDEFAAVPLVCLTPTAGTEAFAYGNPGDLESITTAVRVAGAARELPMWKLVVPLDGAIAPGMSGGGVVADGHLVGITVGVAIASIGGLPSLYGVGFAVPSSVVCDLMGRS